jgi:hypothetical protein
VGNENKLNVRLKRDRRQRPNADPDRTDNRSRTDDGRCSMRDLTDGTTGGRLMRLMVMMGFRGGKPEEGGECQQRGESEELLHDAFLSWPMPKLMMKNPTRRATIVEPVGRSN